MQNNNQKSSIINSPRRRWLAAITGAALLAAFLFIEPSRLAPAVKADVNSTVSLTAPGGVYTQNFNALATSGTTNPVSSLPIGWGLEEEGTSATNNEQYAATNGGATAGDTYSFGATDATERAFGTLLSGTLTPVIGAGFTNNTGATITSLDIGYTGEEWRLGTAGRADQLDFQYSTNATDVDSSGATWIDVNALDFATPNTAAPVGAKDGNAADNRAARSATISGLSIPGGATFFIRWTDFNASGSDDGLAIDDFSLTPNGTTPTGTPTPTPTPSPTPTPTPVTTTLISQIQGNEFNQQPNVSGSGAHDDRSPLEGQTVVVQGVVVGVYPQLSGFFVQEEDADRDADATTSEGIFVSSPNPAVSEGNIVRVRGAVDEFFGMTQIDNDNGDLQISLIDAGNNLALVTPISVELPVPVGNGDDVNDYFERFEGMRVQFPDKLVVSEYFEASRYGQITLTETSRPFQYTHNDDTPTPAEYQAFLNDLERRRIILDDDDNIQNSALTENPQRLFYPQPNGFRVGAQGTDFYRGGDSLTNLIGVLHWSFAGQSGTDAWRVRPTAANPVTAFTVENPRPFDSPEPGGNVKVATFNVLNYFTSIDNGSNGGRGADSAAEFERQNAKLLAALEDIDADVFGLVEIENNGTAVAELVNRLNARVGAGTYNYINTGVVGTDQITAAIIYKPGAVQPSGSYAALTAAAFTSPNGGGQRNRPAVAQTFQVIETGNPDLGAKFTVVVNHLKSKSPGGASGADADQADGQAAFNDTRRKAAAYLVNTWIPSDPTGQGDPDFLILGDLNAYRGEDPIDAIKDAGYTDLIERFNGGGGYSYVFDGQLGYLDHALANASLNSQVVGTAEWHINADENPIFDYNDEIRDAPGEGVFEREPNGNNLYEPNEFRTSDHDPVVIGLDLTVAGPTAASASVGGRLKTASGAPIPGASVALFDAESGETIHATTDIDGAYTFAEVPVGRDYIVTPVALGFSFNPSSRFFSLNEELTTVDFIGARRRGFRKF